MARFDILFSANKDGTGATEMAAAADEYFVAPPVNFTYNVARILLYMRDTGKFAGEKYTATGALSNGIVITKEDAGGVLHTYTPQPIKEIGHWGLLAGVDVFLTDFTTGDDIYIVRWTLSKSEHETILRGDNGEFLKFNVRDSLAEAGSHLVQAQGLVLWTG